MPMIQKQIEELKEFKEVALKAEDLWGKGHNVTNMVDNAIQTITDLSEKLAASNLNGGWIPIETRKITEEERIEKGYPEGTETVFTCPMPDEGEEILVSLDDGYVETDVSRNNEDGLYLENRGEWDNVTAWMPLPKAFEPKKK